jgi:hypothetical protein
MPRYVAVSQGVETTREIVADGLFSSAGLREIFPPCVDS